MSLAQLSVALRERDDEHREIERLTEVLAGTVLKRRAAQLSPNGERSDADLRTVLMKPP